MNKPKDDIPLPSQQEIQQLGAALHDSIFRGNAVQAMREFIDKQMKIAWSGFNSGQPNAKQRYHQLVQLRDRMLGFMAYSALFVDDVESLLEMSFNKCEVKK